MKWKIVKQKLQSPKSVLARENAMKPHKRKKSVDELMRYPRHRTNVTSTVVGRRAKGLTTLRDFPASPRGERTLSSPTSNQQSRGKIFSHRTQRPLVDHRGHPMPLSPT